MRFIVVLGLVFQMSALFAQNLMEERIWKVSPRKKSIFLDSGVFHYNSSVKNLAVSSIRNSVVPGRGFERVVVDFNGDKIPKIYGHISPNKKLSIDFFDTKISTNQTILKNSKYIKDVNFVTVDDNNLTLELSLKTKSSFDVFYLENPGRLVIDIR